MNVDALIKDLTPAVTKVIPESVTTPAHPVSPTSLVYRTLSDISITTAPPATETQHSNLDTVYPSSSGPGSPTLLPPSDSSVLRPNPGLDILITVLEAPWYYFVLGPIVCGMLIAEISFRRRRREEASRGDKRLEQKP